MDLLKEQARSKFNLPPQWNPSNETVWSRLKRRLQYSIPPSVDRTIAEMATTASSQDGLPLRQAVILKLANDYIKGRPVIEQEVIDWQIRHNPTTRARFETFQERPTSVNLGAGWYKGFWERTPDIVHDTKV